MLGREDKPRDMRQGVLNAGLGHVRTYVRGASSALMASDIAVLASPTIGLPT